MATDQPNTGLGRSLKKMYYVGLDAMALGNIIPAFDDTAQAPLIFGM